MQLPVYQLPAIRDCLVHDVFSVLGSDKIRITLLFSTLQ
jgi:hypothetical protein